MRIIVIGDKSRYQIFRSIAENENINSTKNVFSTERLGSQTVKITADKLNACDNVFYSSKLPLATEIIFPSENNFNIKCEYNDKVLVFDEFPYRTSEEVKKLEDYFQSNNVVYYEVILVKNDRQFMTTDISTEEMALKEAEEMYLNDGFYVHSYQVGESYNFLFWNYDFSSMQNQTYYFKKIKKIKENINLEFGFDYEIEYMIKLDKYCSNPTILDSFFEYNKNDLKKNAVNYFINNAIKYYFSSSTNKYFSFAIDLYSQYLKEISLWDWNDDLQILQNNIVSQFQTYVCPEEVLFFDGQEDIYNVWLNDNKELIVEIKNRIVNFFRNKLSAVIQRQMLERIDRLEELLNEKDI